MDIRATLAEQAYQGARPATVAEPRDAPGPGETFREVAQDFAQTLRAGEEAAMDAMIGKADPHALVQALAQTELAVQTAVTVRDKVVEAYQEILRMPV
jgi:flagellar hook-basal body complex protein FliE